ncbi:MAG TPA: hypothetical protein EYF95_05690 [Flavobacteriales bacterium]|nr:hypothetical protein [Flavobacteriales bacterium]
MKNLISVITVLFLIGMVDSVEDGIATVELTDSNYRIQYADMPVALFPCTISEGDFFHFAYIDGVTEIRCGEPE